MLGTPGPRPRAISAVVADDRLRVALEDGREVSVPLDWFGWLKEADDSQRRDVEVIEYGLGIWWRALDEGVSVPWLLGLPHH